ncbi:Prolyl-tRNA synthetase associated domain-containing protein 1 [Glycine max]|nr:Prolyl-tRNA synthetase associated domain-containing protein 1 [Glycine max]
MGFSKEQLLVRLKELHINFSQYEHPTILTVEEGGNKRLKNEKYVGHLGGGVTKSLCFEGNDKKRRFYLVSALKDTQLDIKVLSQRLGLGKGGLRMTPSEALGEILQKIRIKCGKKMNHVQKSTSHRNRN